MLGGNVDITGSRWLSVIFDGRNKEYGAYELRRENSHTTNLALIWAIGAFLFALATPTIINKIKGFIPKADAPVHITNVILTPPPPIEMSHPLPPPPPIQHEARSVQSTVAFRIPVVKPDAEAQKDPPTEAQLEKADPGQNDVKGSTNGHVLIDETPGLVDNPGDGRGSVTEGNSDAIFTAVEIAPEFPGGEEAFGEFLKAHIKYPTDARENGIAGKVYIQFIVERDGGLTDIKVLREPGYGLGAEAARVLKLSPKWRVGMQNGRPVRVCYVVPVNFSLGDN